MGEVGDLAPPPPLLGELEYETGGGEKPEPDETDEKKVSSFALFLRSQMIAKIVKKIPHPTNIPTPIAIDLILFE